MHRGGQVVLLGMRKMVALLFVEMFLWSVAGGAASDSAFTYSVEPMAEYDALFCRTQGWTGADAAYSVALKDDVTLWLYGDTWVGDVLDGRHKNATMVNNSIALQRGREPSTASVRFFWQTTEEGKPEAFVKPADGKGWFWISDGVMAGGKLYLFLMQIVKSGDEGVFGFKHTGTWLGEVENPQDGPPKWRIRQHKVPWGRYSSGGNLFFGSAVMKDGDFVYVYGASEDWSRPMGGRSMIVARMRTSEITDFGKWWFFGDGSWSSDIKDVRGLFDGTATEYSVCYQPAIKKYVTIYTENGMSKNILMRTAATAVGPWSEARKIYECPDCDRHKSYFCYAAKGHHPELSRSSDELIVTYVCNSTDFGQMVRDAGIYRPRFVRVRFVG